MLRQCPGGSIAEGPALPLATKVMEQKEEEHAVEEDEVKSVRYLNYLARTPCSWTELTDGQVEEATEEEEEREGVVVEGKEVLEQLMMSELR